MRSSWPEAKLQTSPQKLQTHLADPAAAAAARGLDAGYVAELLTGETAAGIRKTARAPSR